MRMCFGVLALVSVCLVVRAEPPVRPAPGSVQVMFLPPPLEVEAVYSVGVYETKTGRLVRRLHEDVEDGAFTAGLNGFITSWDRKDDAGKTVPAGRYAARGWAVGEMKVEGVDILGNEWTNEDGDLRVQRVEAISLVPADGGLVVLATMADAKVELLRVAAADTGRIGWRRELGSPSVSAWGTVPRLDAAENGSIYLSAGQATRVFAVDDGREMGIEREDDFTLPAKEAPALTPTPGRDGSIWSVGPTGLRQSTPNGEVLRRLPTTPGEPAPRAVAASRTADRLYLLEESDGWQRVRGLEFSETKPEADGRPVSDWKTFFERNIHRINSVLGLDKNAPSPVVELPLAENPLEPGKPSRAKLRAGFDATGSYLETADGLRLLPVSARPNLRAARLGRDPKAPGRLLFYQFDGAAWDVFSVSGVPAALVGFDAGEFELTADGERHPPPPADEPRDP